MKSVPAVASATRRAILYDRVSTVLQSKVGYSGGADGFQLDQCREHASRRGYDIVAEITDVDSGAEWNIDGIMSALDRAKCHEYDVLVVSSTSRFARNLAKKTVYEAELRRGGVAVEYLNLPDLDGPEGRFMSNVFGALDELEREQIAYRTKNGKRTKARHGKVVGTGRAPYGYDFLAEWVESKHRDVPVGLAPKQPEADVAVRIFRELPFQSTIGIANRLTDDGIATPTGRGERWQASTVRAIATNPAYRGEWKFAGISVPVTPLVDARTWQDAQRYLRERRAVRRGRQAAETDAYELRGLLTCGHCDGVISTDRNQIDARSRDRTHRVYHCLRHQPSRAARSGWDVCPQPSFKAADDTLPSDRWHEGDGIEHIAWRLIVAELLDADLLDAKIRRLNDQHSEARAERQRRLQTLDDEIASQGRIMRRAEEEKLKLDADDPRYQIHLDAGLRAAVTIRRLRVERERFAAKRGVGLDDDQRERLREWTAELKTGLQGATAAERRKLYQIFQLRARVYADRERGVRVGYRAWLRIEWEAVVPLADSEQFCLKLCLLYAESGLELLVAEMVSPAAGVVGA